MSEHLLLKWGSIKGWSGLTDTSFAILQKWAGRGFSMSAAEQHDTPEQKAIVCELIGQLDGEITNDWTGNTLTKDEAISYIMEYGK